MSLKGYIYVVSIQGSCLKLLQVAFASCLPSPSLFVLVRLLPQDDLSLYLYLRIFYCACIFNFLEIYAQVLVCIGSVPAYLIPRGYMHKLCTFSSNLYGIYACMFNSRGYVHKFCTFSFVLYGICAWVFNSQRICTQVLGVLTYREVLGGRSTKENDLLRSVLVTLEGAFLVILNYEEVFGV